MIFRKPIHLECNFSGLVGQELGICPTAFRGTWLDKVRRESFVIRWSSIKGTREGRERLIWLYVQIGSLKNNGWDPKGLFLRAITFIQLVVVLFAAVTSFHGSPSTPQKLALEDLIFQDNMDYDLEELPWEEETARIGTFTNCMCLST